MDNRKKIGEKFPLLGRLFFIEKEMVELTNQEIQDILNKLRDGELEEYCVSKEDFMAFRKVLIEREDFKHFHGTAKRGGSIVYRYTKDPRS